jgi:hypothetical protein
MESALNLIDAMRAEDMRLWKAAIDAIDPGDQTEALTAVALAARVALQLYVNAAGYEDPEIAVAGWKVACMRLA